MFSGAISHLTALSFHCVETFKRETTPGIRKARARRPKIKTLELEFSAPLDDWLVDSTCPFDLTGLVDVGIWVGHGQTTPMSANLLKLLHSTRLTIERLTFAAYDFEHCPVDLGQFPNMTHLHVHAKNACPLAFVVPSVPSLNGHSTLRCITLGIEQFRDMEWTSTAKRVEASLLSIDAALTNISLPALEQVEIRLDVVSAPEAKKRSLSQREVIFRRALPNLSAKGILSIVVESEWIYPRTEIKRAW
ncbi:hypothetical protein FB451DRAFT_1292710 [Mycena latifolia]|nr:hypothetical protein FB451DRAFT_1292710 [Mycena latifolia]